MFTTNFNFNVPNEKAKFSAYYIYKEIFQEHFYISENCDIKPGDVVVDVGANIGLFSLYALSKGTSKVIAIDCDQDCINTYYNNLGMNGKAHLVELIQKGVWSHTTIKQFKSFLHKKGSSYIVDCHQEMNPEGQHKIIEIPVTTIDEIVEHHKLDFIKMDIEGSEIQALMGASHTIARFKPKLAISTYHSKSDLVNIPHFVKMLNPEYWVKNGTENTKYHETLARFYM